MRHSNFGNRQPQPKARGLTFQHGHDGTHVVLVMDRPVGNIRLTLQECDDFLAAIKVARDKLVEHMEANRG